MTDTPNKPRTRGRPFVKGQSGNPGGRPKMPEELKAAMQALSDKAVKVLEEAMDGDDPRTRILAANAVLDRGYGKPAQTVNAKFEGVDMDGAYLEALKEINRSAKTAPANGTTPVNDGTATTALTMLATQGTAD